MIGWWTQWKCGIVLNCCSLLSIIVVLCIWRAITGTRLWKCWSTKILPKSLFQHWLKANAKSVWAISKWDHFVIANTANFVSSSTEPDTIYNKITAVDCAIEQYVFFLFPYTLLNIGLIFCFFEFFIVFDIFLYKWPYNQHWNSFFWYDLFEFHQI